MITLDHITVSFGQRCILDNISAGIAEGRITAVMGPNGCGKTTLLRCIGGLLEPTGGQVLIDGRRVKDFSARTLAQKVAFVRQQAQTDSGTWHLRMSKPHEKSGGELQRVMIARALAQQTPVLLMDEPVSNLDIAHQLEIMRLLRNTDKSVVIVIHDLNLALQFCDDLLLFHEGKLLYNGPMAGGLTPENIRIVYGVETHTTEGRIIFNY